jgi:hypothetical protein
MRTSGKIRAGARQFSPRQMLALSMVSCSLAGALARPAAAQVPQTLNGPPVQVTPYAPEPGVPIITITPGTVGPTGTDGSGMGAGTGDGNTGASGTGGGDVLGTMLGTSWGGTAVADAQALGLNPTALAATCVIESGCGANLGSGGAQGMFQMFPAAYQEGLQTALVANPSLASQIVQGSAGMNDPTTEAIAASGYLLQAATSLESAGITNPTILDARGYYNFGPSNAAALANAQDEQTMASVLYNLSPATLLQNGITPGETVGQWRTSIVNQIGNSANQSVLT